MKEIVRGGQSPDSLGEQDLVVGCRRWQRRLEANLLNLEQS